MTEEEKKFWGDTPQHIIDFANKVCADNRRRMERQRLEKATRKRMHHDPLLSYNFV